MHDHVRGYSERRQCRQWTCLTAPLLCCTAIIQNGPRARVKCKLSPQAFPIQSALTIRPCSKRSKYREDLEQGILKRHLQLECKF